RSGTEKSSSSRSTPPCASAPARPTPQHSKPALKRLATGVRPMTFKKPTRAGLLALALGVLFTLFLSMSALDHSYAEEAAATPAAAAGPPACPGNPDPKFAVLEKGTPNSGDPARRVTPRG